MTLQASRRRLSGQVFEGQAYEGLDLRGGLAASSIWRDCTFDRVKFGQADFGNATFEGCRFTACDFGQATMVARIYDCSFAQVEFGQANLSGAHIVRSRFTGCRFQYASFYRATLERVTLEKCNLHGANLDFAESFGIDFRGSNLWAAVVPLNCAFFQGNRFDAAQVHRFMALLDHAENDQVWQEYRQHIPTKQWAVVHRLVQNEKEGRPGDEGEGRPDDLSLAHKEVQVGHRRDDSEEGNEAAEVAGNA